MAKSKTAYACTECGGTASKWQGQCPNCGVWNTLVETIAVTPASRFQTLAGGANVVRALSSVDASDNPRAPTGIEEFDRVLGGGLVPGGVILLGGDPGIGKSTLLLQAMASIGVSRRALYVTGEESADQIGLRAQRLGLVNAAVELLAEVQLEAIVGAIRTQRPDVVVIDSIQTVYTEALESAPGSVAQVRECAAQLTRLAKQTGITILLVGHVTKEGAIAGPRVLEHIVDTVLYLEGDRRQELRLLRAMKNRFGSAEEIGVFAMGERGLEEVPDPSAAMLSQTGTASAGTAVVVVMEGTRPLLIEIQSLVNKANTNFPPRRVANGFDLNRVHMLLAVLDRRGKTPLGQHDVFVNVAGGIRITEPAADLGLALSIYSNTRDRPLPDGLVVLGELGLAGEVRRVGQTERRLQEAARHGFTRALIPSGSRTGRPAGLEITEVRTLAEAISALFPNHIHSGAFIEEAGVTVS